MRRPLIVREIDEERQQALAEDLSISRITASVLLARGIVTTEQARQWLRPGWTAGHDPFLLPDMERAIDRLHRAVRTREPICFYGDYDVDGVTAVSIYKTFFGGLGLAGRVYIPHRIREGYGLNQAALRRLRKEGVQLLVTSDCGTTSHEEIRLAQGLGMDIIITDHHQLEGGLPPALAVVNPYREDGAYPFRELCSAGLAYKVAQAYEMKHGSGDLPVDHTLDLAALATVADVMPLVDENRAIVREGLAQITRGSRCGIRALKRVARVDKACTAESLAFRLAPRINAAGRLADAQTAVTLLTTESDLEAARIADELESLNKERQRLEKTMKVEAVASLEAGESAPAIVLSARHWHLGVVGIVAARLVEQFQKPALVLSVNGDGIGKGSARTVAGFDLHAALSACKDLLIGFGGHPSAAGLTIHESQIPAFRDRFAQLAGEWIPPAQHQKGLHVDVEVHLREVNHGLVRELDLLHPFGIGNPEPTLAVRNVSLLDARVVGDRHLKLTVRHKNSVSFHGIGFRMGSPSDHGLSPGQPVDLAFVPELDHWNGLDRLQLRIRDLRPSDSSECA